MMPSAVTLANKCKAYLNEWGDILIPRLAGHIHLKSVKCKSPFKSVLIDENIFVEVAEIMLQKILFQI